MKCFCTEPFYNKLGRSRLLALACTENIFLIEKPVFPTIAAIVIVVVVAHAQVKNQFVPKRRVRDIIRDYSYRYTYLLIFFLNIIMRCAHYGRVFLPTVPFPSTVLTSSTSLRSIFPNVNTRKIAQWPYCKFDLAMQIVTHEHIYRIPTLYVLLLYT